MESANENDFLEYCMWLEENNYQKKEECSFGKAHKYCSYFKDNEGIFINYFSNTSEITAEI